MADVNTTYEGYSENYGMITPIIYPSNGVNPEIVVLSQFQADALNADFKKINDTATQTIADVKLPFFGTTTAERLAWINERLKAIQTRALFIQKRVEVYTNILKENGQASAGETAYKTFNSAFALVVPGVGPIVGAISGAFLSASKQDDIQRAQTRIQVFQTDIESLAAIQAALTKQSATIAANVTSSDPTSNVATVIPTWYYYVGAALLLLLLIWLARRKR